jgi:hypothetical protein
MMYMFHLNKQMESQTVTNKDKVRIGVNFFSCYKNFFGSTLLYESLSLCTRIGIFSYMQNSSPNTTLINSMSAGAATQLIYYPLFVRNIANHTAEVGRKFEWLPLHEPWSTFSKKLGALAGRGAVLGVTHLYAY